MSQRLNQVIAIEKGIKAKTQADLTEAHHALQKPALLSGIARTYRPKDDEGEKLPSESTKVQVRAEEMIRATCEVLARLFDVTATKDWANCHAFADVIVDGKVLVSKAPVPYLLFLEKQLVDLHTFVKKLPVLDPSETWVMDQATNCWATEPAETTRTKKIMRNHIKAEATDKHPAQVDTYTEDVVVGYWKTVKYSGALPARRVQELLERVTTLQKAVKFAREEANSAEANSVAVGSKILGYLFG